MSDQTQTQQFSDHDLLIRLDTRLENLECEMRAMRDGTRDDIKTLQLSKLESKDFDSYKSDHAREYAERLRNTDERHKNQMEWQDTQQNKVDGLQRFMYLAMGALTILQFASPFIIKLFIK